jgi:hypothetical protein
MKKMSKPKMARGGGNKNPPGFEFAREKAIGKSGVNPKPQPGMKVESRKMLSNSKAKTAARKEGIGAKKVPSQKKK